MASEERSGSPEESEAEARESAEELERDAEDMESRESAEELERDAEDMESRAEEVDRRIAETESDWESKKDAGDAPGAQPSESERDEQDEQDSDG